MTMTPREIQEKQFHDAFRGYSHEEVDLFIDQVAEAYDQVYRENLGLNKQLEEIQGQLAGKPAPAVIPAPVTVQAASPAAPFSYSAPATNESEDMLKRMLLTAQETADKAVQSARARAQNMIEESEARARRIEEQAEAISSTTLQDAQRRAAEMVSTATQEETELKDRIEGLKTFERDFRSRLSNFVRSQLELLESRPMVQAASGTQSSGFRDRVWPKPAERERTSPAPARRPAPAPATQWASLGEKSSDSPKPDEPVGASERSATKSEEEGVEASSSTTGQSAQKTPGAPENKSIRELFWGED